MTTMMTISDPDWTIDGIAAAWMDDEPAAVAREAADTEAAWLINHTHEYLPGWSYSDGTFSGPANADAYSVILDLLIRSGDYAIENLDEIRELAAEG